MKSDILPKVKIFALHISEVTGYNLRKSLKLASEWYDEYLTFLVEKDHYRKPAIRPKLAIRELLFQGFILEEDFKKKEGCNYVITNINIGKKNYIYPVHCFNGYHRRRPYIYKIMNYVGVPGYTGVDIKFKL